VVDDILDVTQASETLGKTAGKDAGTTSPPTCRCSGWTPRGATPQALRDQAHEALARSGLAAQPGGWPCWPTRSSSGTVEMSKRTSRCSSASAARPTCAGSARAELPALAAELRAFVLDSVSQTGGHLSATSARSS
jgi:hypothetical protein